jgi:hypothetical protein
MSTTFSISVADPDSECMFLGLLDSDPLVKGMDPDLFRDFFMIFYL